MPVLFLAASPDQAFNAVSHLVWWQQCLAALGFAMGSVALAALADRWDSCLLTIFAFAFAIAAITILIGAL